jgi:hypothetical protein
LALPFTRPEQPVLHTWGAGFRASASRSFETGVRNDRVAIGVGVRRRIGGHVDMGGP